MTDQFLSDGADFLQSFVITQHLQPSCWPFNATHQINRQLYKAITIKNIISYYAGSVLFISYYYLLRHHLLLSVSTELLKFGIYIFTYITVKPRLLSEAGFY